MSELDILSLGAGIESSTILLMSAAGILPRLHAAIFSDTKWEAAHVYHQLEYVKDRAAYSGIPVHVVTAGNLRSDALHFREFREASETGRWASMPLYIKNPDGSRGIINRQCTSEYKIEPVQRFIREEILGLKSGERTKECRVRQWMGISSGEKGRIRIAQEKWKRNQYPLCNWPDKMLPLPMSRHDCRVWLETNHPEIEWKGSACIGCPFRRDADWRELTPEEFADAVEFDNQMREAESINQSINGLSVGVPYLHDSLVPLGEIDFSNAEDLGQRNWTKECAGVCGV